MISLPNADILTQRFLSFMLFIFDLLSLLGFFVLDGDPSWDDVYPISAAPASN